MKYEINGKIEDEIKKINGLNDLIGLSKGNIFKCKSIKELENKMSDMSLIDLQKMAVSCGISGGGSRLVLKEKIKTYFEKYNKGNDNYSIQKSDEFKLEGENIEERKNNIKNLLLEGF